MLHPVSKIFRKILTHEKRVGIPSIKTILCPSVRYMSGGRDVHFWVLMFKKSLISQEDELKFGFHSGARQCEEPITILLTSELYCDSFSALAQTGTEIKCT